MESFRIITIFKSLFISGQKYFCKHVHELIINGVFVSEIIRHTVLRPLHDQTDLVPCSILSCDQR